MLVTASHLIAALGKLLLYDLDSFFPTDRVFSACAVSKTDLFARLVNTHLNEHGHTRYVRFMICASVSRGFGAGRSGRSGFSGCARVARVRPHSYP